MRAYLSGLMHRIGRLLAGAFRAGHAAQRPPVAARAAATHVIIASHLRRYPGRTDALSLRQQQGWTVGSRSLAHQDRRA